jgi:ankyrin repeat protein
MLACIYGKFDAMEELLTAGADTSARDDVSYPPLSSPLLRPLLFL